jgi:hypothetical protein
LFFSQLFLSSHNALHKWNEEKVEILKEKVMHNYHDYANEEEREGEL